jgi:small subunit ribosomal protein S21
LGGDFILVAHQRTYFPEEKNGICVVKREGEDDEDLIKRFRKKFSKSGLAKELRDRMFYEKPSEKRRRKKAQNIRNIEKEEEKLRQLKEKAKKAKAKRQRREWKYDKSSRRQSRSSSYEKGEDGRRDSDSG